MGRHQIRKRIENVVTNDVGVPDYDDDKYTENTRVCYPRDFIENSVRENEGDEPDNIIFLPVIYQGFCLLCLVENAAAYHFLSGYTAKLAQRK